MTHSALTIRGFSYTYPGAGDPVLKNIHMVVPPGECHCIIGPTGAGKSTLLLAVKGLLPEGTQSGEISSHTMAASARSNIGIVLQNPETQLLGTSVGSEVAFGLENLCVPPFEMKQKVTKALLAVGLNKPLDFPVSSLSMGQKYRLIMASVIVMAPSVLLLDEPGAQLDEDGIEKLKKIIFPLKTAGVSILICEHHPHYFSDLIDAHWEINNRKSLNKITADKLKKSPDVDLSVKRPSLKRPEKIIAVKHFAPPGSYTEPFRTTATFSVYSGQRMGIYGENGAGKTTLLRCLTGFIPPLRGDIKLFGMPPSPKRLRGTLGCLFQNPEKQLFENTVFDEIAFPLKRLGVGTVAIKKKVDDFIDRMEIAALAPVSPHKLSFGQKHLVVLASILIFEPRLLILDDPFAGLDHTWRKKIRDLLYGICESLHTTLVWTGHRHDELLHWADMILDIKGGEIAVRT